MRRTTASLLSVLLATTLTAVTAGPARADTRGGFQIGCDYSHTLPDDPIVHPDQPGTSHLHDFFGNLSTDASSTRSSLLASNTSCRDWDDTAAYWSPTGYLDGVQITPLRQKVYYFGNAKGSVQTVPADLKIVAGNRAAASPAENPHISWNCGGQTTTASHPYDCRPYAGSSTAVDGVVGHIDLPQCWDGVHLDSADHMSHMAYKANGSCPTGYPIQVPQLEIRVHFGIWDPCAGAAPCGPTDPDTNVKMTLSSGPYYSLHADFWNTWKQGALDTLVTSCLNAHIACGAPSPLTPAAPVVTTSAEDSVVHLSWTPPNGSGITGYVIYRGTTPGGESKLVPVGNVTGYDDTGVSNGTTYYYVIRAVNSTDEGNGSAERSATPEAAVSTAPGSPALSATFGDGVSHLSWTVPSDGGSTITNYNAYRGTASGGESLYAPLGTTTTYEDRSVSNGTTYYYEVSAVNAIGEGQLSNEVSGAPQASTFPGAPTLSATTASGKGVKLSWTVPTSGSSPITGYRVYRSTSPGVAVGSSTLLASVGLVTSYKDSATTKGTTYYYLVTAVSAVGEGAPSNEASAQAR